ncbi:MAG: L-aspartate oxidase [Microbacteriaceae bacterium]
MPSVIVVGSGIAGLVAALTAARDNRVTLVTKSALAESNTFYAQGGIAAALGEDDSVAAHIADTVRAGAGLNDAEAVRVLCSDAPQRIRDLIDYGVAFDRDRGSLARGLEAAHSGARILHAGGDATGAAIETALVRAVRDGVDRILEHTFVTDLIVSGPGSAKAHVTGVSTVNAWGQQSRLGADAVIMASGGAGQLYSHTTNPAVATGDGAAAAWRAGAALTDLEFYQFHPTALAIPGNFLVSEAVRGEGAVLRNAAGKRFMRGLHPDAELAPRDVVARGIAVEMAAQGGAPVFLDATGLGRDLLTTRFPTITRACAGAGLDWACEPVPVTPAAHYWMGGVATDTVGRTSMPGLYAVGEVACTGAHGANRLASNSLLESIVFAHRAAGHLGSSAPWPRSASGGQTVELEVRRTPKRAPDRAGLQQLMWQCAGVHRFGPDLEEARELLDEWPTTTGADAAIAQREDANLVQLARLLVASALARRESRGAHFRSDYPAIAPEFGHHLTITGSAAPEDVAAPEDTGAPREAVVQ